MNLMVTRDGIRDLLRTKDIAKYTAHRFNIQKHSDRRLIHDAFAGLTIFQLGSEGRRTVDISIIHSRLRVATRLATILPPISTTTMAREAATGT